MKATGTERVIGIKMNGTYNLITIISEEYATGKKNRRDVPVAPWGDQYAMKRMAEKLYKLTW